MGIKAKNRQKGAKIIELCTFFTLYIEGHEN